MTGECMLAGMRKAMEIAEQEPLAKVTRKAYSVPAGDSDDEIMDFVERAAQSVYHPTSTCAIGVGRRHAAAGVRRRGPAGRRRLGHADDHARQHERGDDHDRREGGGHHQRGWRLSTS